MPPNIRFIIILTANLPNTAAKIITIIKILTLSEWNKNHPKVGDYTEDDILGDIFAYIAEYKNFYLLLRDRGIFYFLKDIIIDALGPKPEYPNLGAYTAAFITNGIYGWIEEWFLRGIQKSGEEMTRLLKIGNYKKIARHITISITYLFYIK